MPRSGPRPRSGHRRSAPWSPGQVDDLDATLATAFGKGAVLALDKMAIPGVGTVAYVMDTENNVVGLLQPE